MAVGARGRDILWQFLVEALVLSLIGGIIGIFLGVGSSQLISEIFKWPTLISPQALFLSFSFAGGVGIFFGFYPARKAAKLDPIEALRYE
jgi:putative ABC transport system permease protein